MAVTRSRLIQLLVWFGLATISSVIGAHNNPVCRKKISSNPTTVIGPSTFKDLVEKSSVFVDKTLFIKEFLESTPQVTLITYPKRWGKTLNMDMLKTFLQIEVDEKGKRVIYKNAYNYLLFKEGHTNTGDITLLNVAAHNHIIKMYLNAFPVIHISFDGIRHPTFEGAFEFIQTVIKKLFEEHAYLLKVWKKVISKAKKKDEKEKYRGWTSSLKNYLSGEFTVSEAEDSLRFLSSMLKEHYQQDVFVLIDDYDQPLSGILTANPRPEKEKEVKLLVEFMSNLMTRTFHDNASLKKGLITGIVRMARKSFFSGLDNLKEYNILFNKYWQFYGFTRYEVDHLLKEFDITETLSKQAKHYYSGYTIADDINSDQYNPWDIVKFVDSEEVENYWMEAGPFPFAAQMFIRKIPTSPIMTTLLRKGEAELQLNGLEFSTEDIIKVKDMLFPKFKIEKEADDWLFLRILYTFGFLTYDRNSPKVISRVRIANKEIHDELHDRD